MSRTSSKAPRLSKSKIAKRKRELNRLHKIYSWRKMAADIYGGEIKFGTLERFATDKDYIPKDVHLLSVLELVTPPSPYRILPKWYKRSPEALSFFQGMREKIKGMYDEARKQSRSVVTKL